MAVTKRDAGRLAEVVTRAEATPVIRDCPSYYDSYSATVSPILSPSPDSDHREGIGFFVSMSGKGVRGSWQSEALLLDPDLIHAEDEVSDCDAAMIS